MKPVLIQNLIKNNKKHRKVEPTTEKEQERYQDQFAFFVLWMLVIIIVTGLLLS